MQLFISLQKTALFLFFIMSMKPTLSKGTNEVLRRMVGGYTPANVRDPSVIEAAELVVRNLKEGQGPIDRYTFDFPAGSGTSGNFEIKILDASQQVVAGTNFKLQIGIFVGLTCIGGISSTVYRDLMGNFSVSSYGTELTCEEVQNLESGGPPKEDE